MGDARSERAAIIAKDGEACSGLERLAIGTLEIAAAIKPSLLRNGRNAIIVSWVLALPSSTCEYVYRGVLYHHQGTRWHSHAF